MTDGNTVTQVNPVSQECDLMAMQAFFSRVANTIVQASDLGIKVVALADEVNSLRAALDKANETNASLASELHDVQDKLYCSRREVDELYETVAEQVKVIETLRLETADIEIANSKAASAMQATIDGLNSAIATAKADVDYWFNEATVHSTKARDAETKLGAIQSTLGNLTALFMPPPETVNQSVAKPETPPKPAPGVQPVDPDPVTDAMDAAVGF